MPKTLQAYGGFTSADIKNRAEIPAQADMTISGSNVDCVNIKDSDIKNVLGESVTGVGALCISPLVNKWSGFGPTEWYVNAGSFSNRIKTPYSMSNWAGYNHGAVSAGFMGGSHITTFKYISGDSTSHTISAGLQVGEINFPSMVGATHVKMVIKEGSTFIGSNLVAIGTTYNDTTPINPFYNVVMGSRTGTVTYTAYAYLSNGNADELCLFPNVSAWDIAAIQRMPPAAAVTSNPADTTIIKIVAGSATIDLSGNYTISISNITKWNMTPYTGNINIKSELYNEVGTLIATNNSIVTNSSLKSFSGNIGRTTDYDYVVKFTVTGY